ncbi:hypothetical protein [Pararhizobium sp.]|uniref:hypothetical protein n=1 Tax=Pararhizobium sp. TaxID=1977563 RepID=UPI003D0DA55D
MDMTARRIDRGGLGAPRPKIHLVEIPRTLRWISRSASSPQVMNIGDFDDIQRLETLAGNDMLIEVLTHAEIGQFTPRSWTYWHYRLGIADIDQVPPLPSRRFV